jgi:glycosyltransferase involved in cell wall biosynthesis
MVVQAVESVLAQQFTEFELIVVDDGSDDDTHERLLPYHDRLTYLKQSNGGAAAARNVGIRSATGEIVGFLDSDDLWECETLSAVDREFEANPQAGLVSIMAREIAADGSPSDIIYGKHSAGVEYTTAKLLLEDAGGCSWFFVRRELLDLVGGYDESFKSAEECDLVLRLSFATRLHALLRPLLLRRKHDDNLSTNQADNARCWLRILDKLRDEHPEFVSEHPRAYRRAVAKEKLRLGRELLVDAATDPAAASTARRLIRESLFTFPFFRRGLTYLAWAWIAPRSYASWRKRELSSRQSRSTGLR